MALQNEFEYFPTILISSNIMRNIDSFLFYGHVKFITGLFQFRILFVEDFIATSISLIVDLLKWFVPFWLKFQYRN